MTYADAETTVHLDGFPFFVRTSLRTNAPAPACPRDERRGTSEPSGQAVGKLQP
jgi:hypothetical protein